MSAHWRLALRCAAWMVAIALIVGVVVGLHYGGAYAGALFYGAGVGLVSFVSTALTVSMLTARSKVWRIVGGASFVARYGFAAAALGVPAYLGLWPALTMLGGFAGVYLAENMVLLPGASKVLSGPGASHPEREEAERRVGASKVLSGPGASHPEREEAERRVGA